MKIKIALVGDVMLGRGVNEALQQVDARAVLGNTLGVLSRADVRIANLECAITSSLEPWTLTPKVFHFRADPSAIDVLKTARIDACSLANNHSLDFGYPGLTQTIDLLDQAGIAHAGAGQNLNEAARPTIFETATSPPVKIGLIGFTDNEPAFAATATRPGTNYFPLTLDAAELAAVDRAIDQARSMGAEILIFSNHCGPNLVERPSLVEQRFAQAVIDRGADAYYGHSAHNFQGIEIHSGKPILYDTGDFIDDYAVDPVLRNDWSFISMLSFEDRDFVGMELIPVRLEFSRVQLARGNERTRINERMRQLSREFGTSFEHRNGHLILGTQLSPHSQNKRSGKHPPAEEVDPDYLESKQEVPMDDEEDLRTPIPKPHQVATDSMDPERRDDDESEPDSERVLRRG